MENAHSLSKTRINIDLAVPSFGCYGQHCMKIPRRSGVGDRKEQISEGTNSFFVRSGRVEIYRGGEGNISHAAEENHFLRIGYLALEYGLMIGGDFRSRFIVISVLYLIFSTGFSRCWGLIPGALPPLKVHQSSIHRRLTLVKSEHVPNPLIE